MKSKYPGIAPYVAFNNDPVYYTDPYGDDPPEDGGSGNNTGGPRYQQDCIDCYDFSSSGVESGRSDKKNSILSDPNLRGTHFLNKAHDSRFEPSFKNMNIPNGMGHLPTDDNYDGDFRPGGKQTPNDQGMYTFHNKGEYDESTGQHVVMKGNTLGLIAKRYNLPLELLMKSNPQITKPNLIHPGDRINIPDYQFYALKTSGNTLIGIGETFVMLGNQEQEAGLLLQILPWTRPGGQIMYIFGTGYNFLGNSLVSTGKYINGDDNWYKNISQFFMSETLGYGAGKLSPFRSSLSQQQLMSYIIEKYLQEIEAESKK